MTILGKVIYFVSNHTTWANAYPVNSFEFLLIRVNVFPVKIVNMLAIALHGFICIAPCIHYS